MNLPYMHAQLSLNQLIPVDEGVFYCLILVFIAPSKYLYMLSSTTAKPKSDTKLWVLE